MDLSKIKDLKDLQSLLDLMGRYEVVELEIEGEGKKVRLRKADPACHREVVGYAPAYPPGYAPVPPATASTHPVSPPVSDEKSALKDIASPMVGTFYRAASPEAEPYVREGDSVSPESTLCIIEAMKVMNEIPAGISGIVREILVKNGESVEFGQPLFRVETD